jgi:hypothetical protein
MEPDQIAELSDLFPTNETYKHNLKKSFLLDNYIQDQPERPAKPVGRINHKTAQKLFSLAGLSIRFEDYIPLHHLWKEYIT